MRTARLQDPTARRPVIGLAAVGFALLLTACGTPRADRAVDAQSLLIGMPRDTLLQCAGVPDRSEQVGRTTYYTYERETVRSSGRGGFGVFAGTGYNRGGIGYGARFPLYTDVDRQQCLATFTLEDDRVSGLSYAGSDGRYGGRLNQCYFIVENCLAEVPGYAPAP